MIGKFLIGFTGVGLTISTWVSSFLYLNKDPSIGALLEKHGKDKQILNSTNIGDGSGWAQAWKNYKEDGNKWSLEDWNTHNEKNDAPAILAKACEEKIKETVKDENDSKYNNFVRWCSK